MTLGYMRLWTCWTSAIWYFEETEGMTEMKVAIEEVDRRGVGEDRCQDEDETRRR